MALNTSVIISFIALLVYSGLLAITLTRNARSRITQSFSVYLASMIVWSFGSFMLFTSPDSAATLFWNRFMVIGSMAMPIAFFAFVRNFLMREWRNWLFLGYFLYFATQVANGLGLVVRDAHLLGGQVHNTYGPAIGIPVFSWVLFVGFSTLSLFHEYYRTLDVLYRNRLRYLLVVILAITLGSLTNATPLSVFPVDIAFNLIAALLTAYAILRHQLLDITVVFRKGLLYFVPTVMIGAAYFLVIIAAVRVFHTTSGHGIFLISLPVAILTALVAEPARHGVQTLIDRLIYRDKFDTNAMLQRLNRTTAQVLDLEQLTHIILAEVTTTLHASRAAFLFRRSQNGRFRLGPSLGLEARHGLQMREDHPLLAALRGERQIVTAHQLEVEPRFRGLWQSERDDLSFLGMELYIALKTKGDLVAIFGVGPRRSGQAYTQDEQATLIAFGAGSAAAIENAILFDAEGRRRLEAEALQNALAELTSALDIQQILDSLLVHLDRVVPCDSACVFLLRGEELHAVAARGFPDPRRVIDYAYPVAEDTLFKEIRRSGRPLVLDDASSDARFRGYGGIRTVGGWMGVPLTVRGRVIGLLTLDSRHVSMYSSGEAIGLAQAFANHAAIAVENARLFQIEREQRHLAEALREVGTVLNTTLDFDQLLNLLLDQIARVVAYDAAGIHLVFDGHLRLARSRHTPEYDALFEEFTSCDLDAMPDLKASICTGRPIVLPDVAGCSGWCTAPPSPTRSWMAVPACLQGRAIAVFTLFKAEADFYQADHGELLSIFAGQAALALQNATLYGKVRQLAITDELTGISNRRHLIELGEREFNRALRFSRPLSAAMLDLDNFKRINDRHGHAVGDQVLRQVANHCRENIRDFDVLGRYGGEEFVILLPETTLDEAQAITERLRKRIAAVPIPTSAGALRVTVSLGVAGLGPAVESLAGLIDAADQAMYAAKRKGRNYVAIAQEPHTELPEEHPDEEVAS